MSTKIICLADEIGASTTVLNGQQVTAMCSTEHGITQIRKMVERFFQKVLVLDCSGIDFMDVGIVLDAIIPAKEDLLRQGRTLVIDNPCRGVLTTLRAAIANYREQTGSQFCILVRVGGDYHLIGHIEPNLMTAFSMVTRKGSITATELQRLTGIPVCNASTRLKRLLDAGILVRERLVDKTGAFHLYTLPRIA